MSEDLFEHRNLNDDGARRDGDYRSAHKGNGPERPRFVRRERAGSSDFSSAGSGRPRFNTARPNDGERYAGGSNYRNNDNDNYRGGHEGYRTNNDGYRNAGYRGNQDRQGRYGNSYGNNGGYEERPRQFRPRVGGGSNYAGPQRTPNNYNARGYERQELGEPYRSGGNRFGNNRPAYGAGQRNDRPHQGQGYTPRFRNYHAEGGGNAVFGNRQERPFSRPNAGGYGNGYGNNGGGGFQKHRPAQRTYNGNYDPNAKYSQKKRLEYKEKNVDPNQPLRLNKFLANAGICSRRDADKYITSGVITVNGEVVTELGTKVLRSDNVMFHDQPVKLEKKVYVLLNKPKGYVTTSEDPQNRKTVMDLVRGACPERIYPVGRLDRSTTGVLLFTNDGELASKLTHPKFLKKKIYHVFTDHNVTAADLRQIAEGVTLEDGEVKADAVEYASETDKKQVGIEIHSGKNRIVRRIFEHLGYHVLKLDRVYFAGLTKKNVKRGDWRYLTEKEVDMLRMGAFE